MIFTSPLRRARETAEIVAEPHGLAPEPVPHLIECDVGNWEGMSWDDIRTRDRQYYESFERDCATVPYMGGESFQQVQDRAVPAMENVIASSNGHIAVVTHNIVGRVYVAHVLRIATARAREIQLDNTGISIVDISDGRPKLTTLNSVLHLDGLIG
jgi:broad specificity phosphatase PhoE